MLNPNELLKSSKTKVMFIAKLHFSSDVNGTNQKSKIMIIIIKKNTLKKETDAEQASVAIKTKEK